MKALHRSPHRHTTLPRYLLLCCLLTIAPAIFAEKQPVVELRHWWVSPGELKALKVIEQAITERGGLLEASAVKNFDEHRKMIIQQMNIGYFPAATHWLGGDELLALKQQGIMATLPTNIAGKALNTLLSDEVLAEVAIDDQVAALPVGIHLWNTIYYNAAIYRQLALSVPNSWDELIKQFHTIQQAGIVPLALSSDPWQLGFVLDAILLNKGSAEAFEQIFDKEGQIRPHKALIIEAYTALLGLKPFTTANHDALSWNENTMRLANGEAAVQLMGDFARGELVAAGKLADTDFFCRMSPGTENYLYYGVDVFALLKVADPELIHGQQLLVETVLDPAVQSDYIAQKGGLPVRNDVDVMTLDSCTARMYRQWQDADKMRIPLPAGNSRLRMALLQKTASRLWRADNPDIAAEVEAMITTIERMNAP